jgi:hypothetical protein
MKSFIALLLIGASESHMLTKKTGIYSHIKNRDWSEVANLSNVDDYASSQASSMSEQTISNPSDYNLSADQFKAQEQKYKDDETKALKDAKDSYESSHKGDAKIEDSFATVNNEMQAIKKLQMDAKSDQVTAHKSMS